MPFSWNKQSDPEIDEIDDLPTEPRKANLPPPTDPPWLARNRSAPSPDSPQPAPTQPYPPADRPVVQPPPPVHQADDPPQSRPIPVATPTPAEQVPTGDQLPNASAPPQMAQIHGWNERWFAARREWDDRVATHVRKERLWQKIAFGCMAVAAVGVVSSVILSNRMTIVPHIVEVDREGTVVSTYGAQELRQTVDDRIYRSVISSWIVAFRTVTIDTAMQNRLLHQVESNLFGGTQAYDRIRTLLREQSPFQRAATMVVQPKVTEIRKLVAQANSWYVQWTERVSPRAGGEVMEYSYSATLVCGQGSINTKKLATNPLGIYIVEIDFTGQPKVGS